ncbi:MAG: methyltransferase domain-containing protein [Rhodospirillaceae bacterium]
MTPVDQGTRKKTIAAAFGAAADGYEDDADSQRLIANKLAECIASQSLPDAPMILEIGCGTGFLNRALHPHLPKARWLITDLSEPMVKHCQRNFGNGTDAAFLVMDGEQPCFASGALHRGFDLICANLALQWFVEPKAALAAWTTMLRPGGLLAFSTLADGSFSEWRVAHQALGLAPGSHIYPNAQALGRMLPENGIGRIEFVPLVHNYTNGYAFLKVLKRIGAEIPTAGYQPLPPGALRRLLRRFDGGINVTYHVAYGLFRKDDEL